MIFSGSARFLSRGIPSSFYSCILAPHRRLVHVNLSRVPQSVPTTAEAVKATVEPLKAPENALRRVLYSIPHSDSRMNRYVMALAALSGIVYCGVSLDLLMNWTTTDPVGSATAQNKIIIDRSTKLFYTGGSLLCLLSITVSAMLASSRRVYQITAVPVEKMLEFHTKAAFQKQDQIITVIAKDCKTFITYDAFLKNRMAAFKLKLDSGKNKYYYASFSKQVDPQQFHEGFRKLFRS